MTISKLIWVRTNQENISLSDPLKGPGRDHSNNSVTGVGKKKKLIFFSVSQASLPASASI